MKNLKDIEKLSKNLYLVKSEIDNKTFNKIKNGLNKRLIIMQELNDNDVSMITFCHALRIDLDIYTQTNKLSDNDKKLFNDIVTRLEFECQKYWGFEQDEKFHQWWFNFSSCQCPQMDNRDNIGCEYRIVNNNCPLHGDFKSKDAD